MMETVAIAFRVAAPFYNLFFAFIALFLFAKLLKLLKSKGLPSLQWQLILYGLIIFLVEEVMTILKIAGFFSYPAWINAVFELIIVTLYLYMLFLQKEYVRVFK